MKDSHELSSKCYFKYFRGLQLIKRNIGLSNFSPFLLFRRKFGKITSPYLLIINYYKRTSPLAHKKDATKTFKWLIAKLRKDKVHICVNSRIEKKLIDYSYFYKFYFLTHFNKQTDGRENVGKGGFFCKSLKKVKTKFFKAVEIFSES